MDPKYSNIFWHQGVKVFEDKILKGKQGQIKVAHLENDVTKALLNLFEHCGPKVLKTFLQMLNIKQAPEAFTLDFQIVDTESFRRKPNRIMLCIVSSSTQVVSSASYNVVKSIPDACIFNQDTAVLIESKTQSPLIQEQIQSHIKQNLGSATKERIIYWEDIGEKFRLLSKSLKDLDRFLVDQFCGFLEFIGLSEFNGFSELDFSMLGSLGRIPDEDYADYKRLFQNKIIKFMELLNAEVKSDLSFKNYKTYISNLQTQAVGTHSGFCFYDDTPKIHVNHYPNINIVYDDYSMNLALNSETRSAVKCILSCMKNIPAELNAVLRKIPDIKLLVYYKLQYRPMDNFVWQILPGFPKDAGAFDCNEIIGQIHHFETQWEDFKRTILYQMEYGHIRHASGRLFNEKEMTFAKKNPRPNFVIRFGRQYPVDQIAMKKKKIIKFFKEEIARLKPLAELILQ